MNRSTTTGALLALFAIFALPSSALADPETVIPFDGYLELDGVPLDGRFGVRVHVYADAADTSVNRTEEWSADDTRSCDEVDSCLVPFYRGQFSILIGTWDDGVLWFVQNRPEFTISLEIQGADGVWVPLEGRRTLAAVPYALFSLYTSDMLVGGDARVSEASDLGAATVDGALDAGQITATGTASADSLVVTGDVELESDSAEVAIAGELSVGGDLTVADTLEVNGFDVVDVVDGGLVYADDEALDGVVLEGRALANDITLNGNLDFSSSTGLLAGALGLWGGDPLIQVVQVRAPSSVTSDTGVSSASWFCWIGGFRFVNGNWDVSGTDDNVFDVYTYRDSGTWWVRADANNDGTPRREVTMICAQDDLVREYDEWFTE